MTHFSRRRLAFLVLAAVALGLALPWAVHFLAAPAPAEAPEGASNWLAYRTLLVNAPHWMLELTIEVLTGAAAFLWGALWVRRHDRQHHHGHMTDTGGWLTPERQQMLQEMIDEAAVSEVQRTQQRALYESLLRQS